MTTMLAGQSELVNPVDSSLIPRREPLDFLSVVYMVSHLLPVVKPLLCRVDRCLTVSHYPHLGKAYDPVRPQAKHLHTSASARTDSRQQVVSPCPRL